ncbi:tetratricopeptide repeat protein [Pontibacter harenae]|uniref:tetratricopeptide repeat protein n=1 Tax=Pontibacter harenae TaxID=2894083 RepID=UPI001E3191F1|nr:tetratricopeptide repeat protein [Pontibacter harenae]MCC9167085.1 tetratricopeptide repeat protein [Pontibacter harenae]
MKKILLVALTVASIQVASAQKSAVNMAINYQKSGTLDKAQTEIEKATEHKKTKDDPKTWFTRGAILQDMLGHPIYGKTVAADAHQKVISSYEKAVELGGADSEYAKQVPQKLADLSIYTFNQGIQAYNNENKEEALRYFDLTAKLNPADTLGTQNAAIIAYQSGDYDRALGYYQNLLDKGQQKESIYTDMINVQQEQGKSKDEIYKTVQAGLKAFPTSVPLMLQEINYLINAGKEDEVYAKLENAIKATPENASLYFVLGNLNEKKGKIDAAMENYKQVLTIEPTNYDAYYNLAVIEYNKGAEINNKAAKMDNATFQKQGKALEAQAKKHYEASLPYFEKALEIRSDDYNTMQNLFKIYTRLGRKADADRISKQMGN